MTLKKEQIRVNNEKSVLQQIFIEEPISRIQISRNLGLNKSTVSAIYNDLRDEEIVLETGQGDSSEVGGRKPVMITINKEYGYTVNFDLGYRHLDVMCNYIEGTSFHYERIDTDGWKITEMEAKMIEVVKSFSSMSSKRGLLAISVAIHGIVNEQQILNSPFIDMEDVDLHQDLVDEFHVPVVLENEANLVAISQRDFLKGTDMRMNNILVLSIHKGIGAGIIINHNLYRGEYGEAGEIGRSVYMSGNSNPNNVDKIENYASQDAILEQIKTDSGNSKLTFVDVGNLYREGDAKVTDAVRRFCDYLSLLLYNTALSLNPESIFISSDFVENIPDIINILNEKYQQLTGSDKMKIFMMRGARYASLLGGCSAATHKGLEMDGMELRFNRAIPAE